MKLDYSQKNICILQKSKFKQWMRHNEVADQAICIILSVITLLQTAGYFVTMAGVTLGLTVHLIHWLLLADNCHQKTDTTLPGQTDNLKIGKLSSMLREQSYFASKINF